MSLLYLTDMLRVEGFERMHSQFTRLTILSDYPLDYSEIAANAYGHSDLTGANFERSTSSNDEVVVTVKGIPAVDVLLDDLDLRYIALHGTTSPNYYAIMSIKSTGYDKGEAVVIPDFTITLKVNDSNQHLSADMIWQGNASFSTKCQRVMLCAGIPKTRAEVSNMHMGTKSLTSTDFESVGSGPELRMMVKEQRMPPTTKAGRVQSVAMLEASSTDNFAVSRVSNPVDLAKGAIVDINGVGFKIETGSGFPGDPRKKPDVPVKIDLASSLSKDLLYFTYDFKREIVHNYDMPHEGSDITWNPANRNVSFNTTATTTHHNIIKLGSAPDDGNLVGQAITVAFKFRQPTDTGTLGTIFCNSDDYYSGVTELDMLNGASETRGMHYWTWYAGKGLDNKISDSITAGWHTYVLTRGDDAEDDLGMYVDGAIVQHGTNCPVRKYTNEVLRIGGFKNHPRWQSFLGELEYFAVWKRKLTDDEIKEFSEKPYVLFKHLEHVDKPLTYQAIDDSKEFSENLIYYTCSWIDDIASNRPIYPGSSPDAGKALIDPVTDNLIFDGEYNGRQVVDFGSEDKLSSDKFTVSICLKLHSSAKSKALDHALWGFPTSSSTKRVEAKITGTEVDGYKVIFSIGDFSVTADVTWNLLTGLNTWSFTYDSNDRIIIYRNSKRMATKDVGGRRASTVGAIRIGYNDSSTPTFPGEVEYVAVWNAAFNTVKLHDFLEFPYAHLKPAELMDKKPLGRGMLNRNLPINNELGTYVMDGQNEVVRGRSLQVVGKGTLPPEVDFIDRDTVFKIRTSELSGSYNTPAYITGYRTGNEPQVQNRTAIFRCKLRPKPSGAASGVHPAQSTLFCCADTDAYEHRWHVYYGGADHPSPVMIFEFGRTWVKHPFPLADALNYHNFAFVQEYSYSGTTEYITLSIWIDGEKVASKKEADRSPVSVYELDFRLGGYKDSIVSGGKPSDYSRFKGTVESYGVWERALSEAEIKKLHREPYCAVMRNLVDKPNPNTHNVTIASSDLTNELFFYTLDFKNELVNNYWMEKVGVDIRYIYATSNVYFDSNINNNRIFLMPPTPGYDYQPKYEITILWRARRIDSSSSWAGNYFCCPNRRGSTERISSHVCKPSGDNMDFIVDPGDLTKNRLQGTFPHGGNAQDFFTMALRITNLGNHRWRYQSFARGNMVAEAVHPSPIPLFENWRMAIGGWEHTNNYQGAKMEMEYFAFWARALSDDELTYVTENPYAIVDVAPKANINPTITVVEPGDENG